MVLSTIISFVVSLLVGALAIYVGAAIIVDTRDYEHAIFTALIGAIVWGITAFFLGGIPLFGPLIVLGAYLWVIKARYPGGWKEAAMIAVSAWLVGAIVLTLLASVAVIDSAMGVPFI